MSFQNFLCNFKINRFQPLICCCFRHFQFPDVMPVFFEGAKLMVNKGLSNHFQVSHTINLCSAAPSGYRFGATYVGTKQFGPSEAFPVILGDIDPSGNLNANVIHQFAPNVRCKFASQVREKRKHSSGARISQLSPFLDPTKQTHRCTADDRLQGQRLHRVVNGRQPQPHQ